MLVTFGRGFCFDPLVLFATNTMDASFDEGFEVIKYMNIPTSTCVCFLMRNISDNVESIVSRVFLQWQQVIRCTLRTIRLVDGNGADRDQKYFITKEPPHMPKVDLDLFLYW
ncbi:hypothetical protein PIB30_010248 [Stylosanthes scabra]|uniref:Uncharacterized protein n=1 Tax=Stylosanthes scabra TaxID=79078 RepID=A0ABU6S640_9FABA|nr:hypothetical protein [Stylosanthes scabra]